MRTLLILWILPLMASAQKPNMDYKKYAGRYGSSDGICLFDDGRFLMYGYATAVFGDYEIKAEVLEFYPDKMELFEVYGHHNESLAKGLRANFKGFDHGGQSYVEFGDRGMKQVFNENANCFDGPFVHEGTELPKKIALSSSASPSSFDLPRAGETWSFDNKEGYNDFILVFNPPRREYEDFKGRVTTAEGRKIIQLSNYGGDEGYALNPSPDEQWAEIMDWKKQYESSRNKELNAVYSNKHYRIFPELALSNYQFDERKNCFVKNAGNNNDEEYFRNNEYDDDRELMKYMKLVPAKKGAGFSSTNPAAGKKQLEGSVFFTVCGEGAERSYHYKGYLNKGLDSGNQQDTPKLETTPPIVVPPPSKKE